MFDIVVLSLQHCNKMNGKFECIHVDISVFFDFFVWCSADVELFEASSRLAGGRPRGGKKQASEVGWKACARKPFL